jgi:hypothetical protein
MSEEPREDLECPAFVWRDDGGGMSMGGLEAVMLLILLIVMAAS